MPFSLPSLPFRRKSLGGDTSASASDGQKVARKEPVVDEGHYTRTDLLPGHSIRRYASVADYLQMVGYLKFESQLDEAGVVMKGDRTRAATDSFIERQRQPGYELVDFRPVMHSAPPAMNVRPEPIPYPQDAAFQSFVASQMSTQFGQTVRLSKMQVVVYLICAFIGLGVVVLPSLMKAGGWFMAPFLSLLTVFAFIEMCRVLCESLEAAEDLRWRSPADLQTNLEKQPMLEGRSSNKRRALPEPQKVSKEPPAARKGSKEPPGSRKGSKEQADFREREASQGLQRERSELEAPKLIVSFEEIGRAALEEVGVYMIRSITLPGFFCSVVVYALLIGQNVSALVARALSMKIIMMLLTPVLIFISVMKDTTLAKAMSVGMCASLTSCVLICIKGMMDASVWQSWPEDEQAAVHMLWPKEVSVFGTMLAVLFSAYSVMGTVPCIRGQMAEPKDFFPAFQMSIGIVFAVYSAVMLASYWGYGANVDENVVHSMMFPPSQPCGPSDEETALSPCEDLLEAGTRLGSNPIGVTMAVLVTVYLFLGFGLMFKCLSGLLQNFYPGHPCFDSDTVQNSIFRGIVVIITVAVGLTLPHFRDFIEIGASVCCSCNNVFFPLIFDYKLCQKMGRQRSLRERALHFLIVVMATICLCLGLYHGTTHLASHLQARSTSTRAAGVQTTGWTTAFTTTSEAPTSTKKMVSFAFGAR